MNSQVYRKPLKFRRRWSFMKQQVPFRHVALEALFAVAGISSLALLFKYGGLNSRELQDTERGIVRMSTDNPAVRRQLDLRDPSAVFSSSGASGFLSCLDERGFVPELTPFVLSGESAAVEAEKFLPFEEAPFVPAPELHNIPVSEASPPMTPPPGRALIFSDNGGRPEYMPLPPEISLPPGRRTLIRIFTIGAIHRVQVISSGGSVVLDKLAKEFISPKKAGMYMVVWPRTGDNAAKGMAK